MIAEEPVLDGSVQFTTRLSAVAVPKVGAAGWPGAVAAGGGAASGQDCVVSTRASFTGRLTPQEWPEFSTVRNAASSSVAEKMAQSWPTPLTQNL